MSLLTSTSLLVALALGAPTAQAGKKTKRAGVTTPVPAADGTLLEYLEPAATDDAGDAAPESLEAEDAEDTQDTAAPENDRHAVARAALVARVAQDVGLDVDPGNALAEPELEQTAELAEELLAEQAVVYDADAPDVDVQPVTAFYTDPVDALDDDPLHLKRVDPSEFDIPMVVNDSVAKWISYFTGTGRKWYAKWLGRSTRVRPQMYAKLDAAGAPRDLVYLSMIESGYNTHAASHAAAVGLWQFIAPTARTYGLRVDWWVDERRDPDRAADAAIGFLTDLHDQFGHWYLAWAGYNGGPGRVSRGVSRHGTKDFWTLVERNAFPAETDNYVPKILAAAIIGKHPERYGFTEIEYLEPVPAERVTVGPSVSVDVLARCAGLTVEEFQYLNPHIRRFALPPEDKNVVYLPPGKQEVFFAALDKIPASERLTYTKHTVRKGETLGQIAARYDVGVSEIQRVNRISNPNRISVGASLVIPVNGAVPPELAQSTALVSSAGGAAKASTRSSSSSTSGKTRSTHTVSKGETLSSIAGKYKVSVGDLKKWNSISGDKILVGQRLKVYTASSSWTTYTVRSGDSLGKIATRHGCTVSELQSWNKISGSTIHPGQKLKINAEPQPTPSGSAG